MGHQHQIEHEHETLEPVDFTATQVCLAIEHGVFDQELEAILTAAHTRKRDRRAARRKR
jgi:hypothetical protein